MLSANLEDQGGRADHAREDGAPEGLLALVVLLHDGLVLQDLALGPGVEHERIIAERELARIVDPTHKVLLPETTHTHTHTGSARVVSLCVRVCVVLCVRVR